MDDRFLGSCLVRPFGEVTPSEGAERVISLMDLGEVRASTAGFDKALTIALWHESFLYEHRQAAPEMTPGVLRALEGLGGAWLSREIATLVVRSRHDDKPGSVSQTLASSKSALNRHVAERETWTDTCAAYGNSFENARPPKVLNRVFQQVVGLLCLVGAESSLRAHVGTALKDIATARYADTDWVALLQETLGRPPGLSYAASGPDHERTYEATCSASENMRAVCSGPSKKTALAAAAERLLRDNFPAVVEQSLGTRTSPRPPLSLPRQCPSKFAKTVGEIARAFELSEAATPWIAQAFLHTSWTYENRPDVARAQQRDHGVLGFIGAQVLHFETCLAETLHVVHDAPEDYAQHGFENRTHAEALRRLGLQENILLGRGQQSHGVSDELASTVFQALMAAVHLTSDAPASVFERWPKEAAWSGVAELIAPRAGRGTDVTTRVQELAATCGLLTGYEFSRSGPDHCAEYTARLSVDSPLLRRRVAVEGTPERNKTTAKHAASAIAVRWIETVESTELIERNLKAGGSKLAGASFLLTHLCESAARNTSISVRWRRGGLLGSGLRGRELERWVSAADRLLAQQSDYEPDVAQLARYFRQASRSSDSALPLADALSSVLEWIVAIDPQEPIDEHQYRRLIDLAAAYRAMGGEQEPISLNDTLEGQIMLSRGLLRNEVGAAAVLVPALVAGAIEALTAVLLASGRPVLAALDGPELLLHHAAEVERDAQGLESTAAVWRELGISIEILANSARVDLQVNTGDEISSGPLVAAFRLSSTPQSSPLASALADLLHDLKNQVAAARALTSAQEFGGRTTRLERQLAASRHLDQAAALAERIRAASSLLKTGGSETTRLSTFLRHYAANMLVRLPASVSLSVGSGIEDLSVAIGEPALTAALDNLIKNAVEAMPDGGRVVFDWTHVEDLAVVEIADDGPGIPHSVREAFESGGRIASTKPGGNGLGLLGVRSLLRRVGGDLELSRSATGASWQLTIPLADEVRK